MVPSCGFENQEKSLFDSGRCSKFLCSYKAFTLALESICFYTDWVKLKIVSKVYIFKNI